MVAVGMPQRYTKLDLARIQLERAVVLFIEGKDYVSSITLAGAAEEILGKLIKLADPKALHAMDEVVEDTNKVEELLGGEPTKRNGVISLANYYRDHLKHIRDGDDLYFDARDEAAALIDRAVSNYWRLTGEETEKISKFNELNYFGDRCT